VHDTAERLRAVVNTAVEAIITIDERGIIESFNVAAEKMFGYRPDEVVGRNVSVLMPSPYHEQHDGYLANYCRTGEARIIGIGREVVGRRKDGTVFPMDLSVGEVHLSSGRMFTGIARDITARKQVEAALRREHHFTTTILETTSALVVVLDRNARIVRFNRACERATGFSFPEVEERVSWNGSSSRRNPNPCTRCLRPCGMEKAPASTRITSAPAPVMPGG
jgi:PAS domain S-box-containing protein